MNEELKSLKNFIEFQNQLNQAKAPIQYEQDRQQKQLIDEFMQLEDSLENNLISEEEYEKRRADIMARNEALGNTPVIGTTYYKLQDLDQLGDSEYEYRFNRAVKKQMEENGTPTNYGGLIGASVGAGLGLLPLLSSNNFVKSITTLTAPLGAIGGGFTGQNLYKNLILKDKYKALRRRAENKVLRKIASTKKELADIILKNDDTDLSYLDDIDTIMAHNPTERERQKLRNNMKTILYDELQDQYFDEELPEYHYGDEQTLSNHLKSVGAGTLFGASLGVGRNIYNVISKNRTPALKELLMSTGVSAALGGVLGSVAHLSGASFYPFSNPNADSGYDILEDSQSFSDGGDYKYYNDANLDPEKDINHALSEQLANSQNRQDFRRLLNSL